MVLVIFASWAGLWVAPRVRYLWAAAALLLAALSNYVATASASSLVSDLGFASAILAVYSTCAATLIVFRNLGSDLRHTQGT